MNVELETGDSRRWRGGRGDAVLNLQSTICDLKCLQMGGDVNLPRDRPIRNRQSAGETDREIEG